jgi:hypothetical protein
MSPHRNNNGTYTADCWVCGERITYDSYAAAHAPDARHCPDCTKMEKDHPAIFAWVRKVVDSKIDSHSKDYYHNLRPDY